MGGKCCGTGIGLDMEGKQGDIKNGAPVSDLGQHITASSTAESLEVWASIDTV